VSPDAKSNALGAVGVLHEKFVFNRRVKVLAHWFATVLPEGVQVLDVGCGDGLISALLEQHRPDVAVRGIDVLPRSTSHIPVEIFDGEHFPFEDKSFDVVLFSDVLHHANDPKRLLREARRVAARNVLIKDHFRAGFMAKARLKFMDWVGNARFGVALPYNYWAEQRWRNVWRELGLEPETLVTKLGLYPFPASLLLDAELHFIASLRRSEEKNGAASLPGATMHRDHSA
jgi:SAM-dependent methyltransferase